MPIARNLKNMPQMAVTDCRAIQQQAKGFLYVYWYGWLKTNKYLTDGHYDMKKLAYMINLSCDPLIKSGSFYWCRNRCRIPGILLAICDRTFARNLFDSSRNDYIPWDCHDELHRRTARSCSDALRIWAIRTRESFETLQAAPLQITPY